MLSCPPALICRTVAASGWIGLRLSRSTTMYSFFLDALLPLRSSMPKTPFAIQEALTFAAVYTVARALQGSGYLPTPPYRPAACILPSIWDLLMSSTCQSFNARPIPAFTALETIPLIPKDGDMEWRFSTAIVSTIATLVLLAATVNRAAESAVTLGFPIHLSVFVKMESILLPTAMDKDTFGVEKPAIDYGGWSIG